MERKFDVYETLTATIIEAIEAGVGKFEMPWQTVSAIPKNASTGRSYSGINILALWASATENRYSTQLWATYQQWREMGAQVRRGQKSATVVFWKLYGQDAETEETAGDELTPSADERTRCFARAYHVFNADQVDGFEVPVQPLISESNRIQDAERFFTNTGARVIEGGNRAYYHSSLDEIHMPPFQAFKKADLFYSTLGHECVHNAAPRIMPG